MTEKQYNIILSALRLFASNGYDNTPTSAIAKDAGVSEGLIFRHFKNKEGLLEAILTTGYEKAASYFEQVIHTKDPKERVRKVLSLPINIPEHEYDFWRLTYAIKWQRKFAFDGFSELETSLTEAFRELGYAHPEMEAKAVEVFIDGISLEILLRDNVNGAMITQLFIEKYHL